MGLSLKVKWQGCLKNTISIFEEQQQHHTHAAFVEAFNKELAKQLFEPMDAEEFQDPEKVSTIWVKNLNRIAKKMNSTK